MGHFEISLVAHEILPSAGRTATVRMTPFEMEALAIQLTAPGSQFLDLETASFQRFRNLRACDAGICGSNRRSFFAADASRSVFQNPTARPARYAAPSAVVSVTAGRTTGAPRMSD